MPFHGSVRLPSARAFRPIHSLSSSGLSVSAAIFLFRSGRRARLAETAPSEFFYGYRELVRHGAPVCMVEEGEIGLDQSWPHILEAAANRIAAIAGLHARVLLAAFRRRRLLLNGGTIVATTHTFGLALAALRRLGIQMPEIIILTMGLIPAQSSALRRRWIGWLLAGTTLATLSKPEAAWLRQNLDPSVRIVDFAFGVDLDFWIPGEEARDDVVLSVGNDWNRDFATLVSSWRPTFPMLEIITSLPVSSDKPNIRVLRGDWRTQTISDPMLRAKIQRARLIVVPLRDTLQPSGQSAALQAMACGRPVIMSANRGCWDIEMLRRYDACRLVPPGDPQTLGDAVATLLANATDAEEMGARARTMLEVEGVSSKAMAAQFHRLIPTLGNSA